MKTHVVNFLAYYTWINFYQVLLCYLQFNIFEGIFTIKNVDQFKFSLRVNIQEFLPSESFYAFEKNWNN